MCRKSAGDKGKGEPCKYVVEDGFNVCVSCGNVGPAALDARNTSFSTWANGPPQRIRTQYTRSHRFVNKIIGALNRNVSHACDASLVAHLRKRCLPAPEEILEGIRTWVTSVPRKPYVHATTYAAEIGMHVGHIGPKDKTRIRAIFDEVFFAHARLGFTGPNFPMTELLHLICETFDMDASTLHVVRYSKRLRCEVRTARYRDMYLQCMTYIGERNKLDLDIFKCRLGSRAQVSQKPSAKINPTCGNRASRHMRLMSNA
jgi:hypothetical protein